MAHHCYVFPHVPKCGGTSLLKSFEESDLSLYVDYDAWVGPNMFRRNNEAMKLDFSPFDIIFGHFPIIRYRGPQYRYIALVRDPVERALSNYSYIHFRWQSGKILPGPYAAMAEGISKGTLSFLDYLRGDPQSDRVYRHFLGYWDPSRFALIGRTDQYDEFLSGLSELLGAKFINDKQERKSNSSHHISEAERHEARKLLATEYAWFDRFVRGARENMRQEMA